MASLDPEQILSMHARVGGDAWFVALVERFYGTVEATTGSGATAQTVQILIPVSVGFLAVLLACVSVGSILLLLFAWRTYFLMSGDFAEEL